MSVTRLSATMTAHNSRWLAAIAASSSDEATAILRRAEALIRAANDFNARIDTLKHSAAQFESQTYNLTHRIALRNAQTRANHLRTQAAHFRARAKALRTLDR